MDKSLDCNSSNNSRNLTNPTVTRKFTNLLRRETARTQNTSYGTTNGTTNGTANGSFSNPYSPLGNMNGESEPLLGGHGSSILHPEPGFWRHLLVNTRSSPGTDNPNPFIRYPAHVWNVTKVTLLSCTFPLCL